MQCLLIDDDTDDQDIFLTAMFQVDPSIECRVASGCMAALALLENNEDFAPEFIFLDINMPRTSGLECLPLLREVPLLQRTKIILFSTSIDSNITTAPEAAAADGILVKPSGFHSLIALLEDVIKRKQ